MGRRVSEPSSLPGPHARRERQRAFWREAYSADPVFFGEGESDFARWCLPILRAEPRVRTVVDLGCGYGRDTRFLSAGGFQVRGVDLSGFASSRAPGPDVPCEIVEADCLGFLERLPSGSLDAVYSNMFYNMDFSEAEHRALWVAVHRALRAGGLHLYSVRSTADPWYGRGRGIAPDIFEPPARGVPMHYFSEEYIRRLAAGRFEGVARVERREGEEEFPISLWYVAERNLGAAPTSAGPVRRGRRRPGR